MTGNELVSFVKKGKQRSFIVAKGKLRERKAAIASVKTSVAGLQLVDVKFMDKFPEAAPAPVIRPLSIMGIGSWPRPRWML
jgi:5-methyltetrahydropteroyltriglutamate--homocysteine methyltransferase